MQHLIRRKEGRTVQQRSLSHHMMAVESSVVIGVDVHVALTGPHLWSLISGVTRNNVKQCTLPKPVIATNVKARAKQTQQLGNRTNTWGYSRSRAWRTSIQENLVVPDMGPSGTERAMQQSQGFVYRSCLQFLTKAACVACGGHSFPRMSILLSVKCLSFDCALSLRQV
jgi:hypothetical protein